MRRGLENVYFNSFENTYTRYPDLVVRVTGFTAYFSMLSPGFRQLVVDRLLEN